MGSGAVLRTQRLDLRPPEEPDRGRFVELFGDERFMEFSAGPLAEADANLRFDHMVRMCQRIPFGKQPVVERASGLVLGYTGVDEILLEGERRLEWGYRLVPESRGAGYATEATQALLEVAHRHFAGDLLAIIAPENRPSQNVCRKVGFSFWKLAAIGGDLREIHTLRVGQNS